MTCSRNFNSCKKWEKYIPLRIISIFSCNILYAYFLQTIRFPRNTLWFHSCETEWIKTDAIHTWLCLCNNEWSCCMDNTVPSDWSEAQMTHGASHIFSYWSDIPNNTAQTLVVYLVNWFLIVTLDPKGK